MKIDGYIEESVIPLKLQQLQLGFKLAEAQAIATFCKNTYIFINAKKESSSPFDRDVHPTKVGQARTQIHLTASLKTVVYSSHSPLCHFHLSLEQAVSPLVSQLFQAECPQAA